MGAFNWSAGCWQIRMFVGGTPLLGRPAVYVRVFTRAVSVGELVGHPLRASLRLLASPYALRRGWGLYSSPRFRRCWTGTFPIPAAPDVARPSDRSAAESRVNAASHRSVISRARSVAAPPRRLAFDVCRIHARSPSPWTSVYRLHAGDHKGRPYGRVIDVWLVLRRHDSAPRLDLVHRCVSNGPGELFILIAIGRGASPKSVNAQVSPKASRGCTTVSFREGGVFLVCRVHALTAWPLAPGRGVIRTRRRGDEFEFIFHVSTDVV